jgi:PAS domain S-box-containing protein
MTVSLSDPDRLRALARTELMDSDPQEPLDRLTRLASGLLKVPVALVSLVDDERQFFVSEVGMGGLRETPLSQSFCQHVVVNQSSLVVYDGRVDPRIQDNLAIPDLGVIAYAGVPLNTADGHTLGSFCAIDTSPREWSSEDLALLGDLARSVMSEIELQTANRELRSSAALLAAIIEHVPAAITVRGVDGRHTQVNSHVAAAMGKTAEEIVGLSAEEMYPPEVARTLADIDVSLRSGVPVTMELALKHADGTKHAYDVIHYPVCDADGTVTGFGSFGMDISGWRRADPVPEATGGASLTDPALSSPDA